MRTTFVHESDGLDGWFELVALAREGLDAIDTDGDEIAELVSEAKSVLTYLEGEIRRVDGVEEPDVENYVPDYQGNYAIARDVRAIAYWIAKIFAPDTDLSAFRALVDAFDTRKVSEWSLEDQNAWYGWADTDD